MVSSPKGSSRLAKLKILREGAAAVRGPPALAEPSPRKLLGQNPVAQASWERTREEGHHLDFTLVLVSMGCVGGLGGKGIPAQGVPTFIQPT